MAIRKKLSLENNLKMSHDMVLQFPKVKKNANYRVQFSNPGVKYAYQQQGIES